MEHLFLTEVEPRPRLIHPAHEPFREAHDPLHVFGGPGACVMLPLRLFEVLTDLALKEGVNKYVLLSLQGCHPFCNANGSLGRCRAVVETAGYAGDVMAQYTLCVLSAEDKRDNPEERAKALPWFRMAAEQNHAESLLHLAEYPRHEVLAQFEGGTDSCDNQHDVMY